MENKWGGSQNLGLGNGESERKLSGQWGSGLLLLLLLLLYIYIYAIVFDKISKNFQFQEIIQCSDLFYGRWVSCERLAESKTGLSVIWRERRFKADTSFRFWQGAQGAWLTLCG